ncbi:MAG: hypothetical protein ACJ790_01850 [Myxococcaceae bacterium]
MIRVVPVLLLLLCACRPSAAQSDVSASEARLLSAVPSFEGDGKGTLDIVVEVGALGDDAVAESVDWELWLNTRHFASGVNVVSERLSGTETRRIHAVVPLVFRGLQTNVEPILLTVGVRGGLRVKDGRSEARYPFELVTKQSVAQAPVLESGGNDD